MVVGRDRGGDGGGVGVGVVGREGDDGFGDDNG